MKDLILTPNQTFLRYFKPDDAPLVENLFRAIAKIPYDLVLSDKDAVQDLISKPLEYTAKFNQLSIYFLGDNPGLLLPLGPGPQGTLACEVPNNNNADGLFAYLVPIYNGKSAIMSICKNTYNYPTLDEIKNPPSWAIDPDKDQSQGPQFYSGYGCANLGDFDSCDQASSGEILLHELFHFPALFADVPDYAAKIVTTGDVVGTGPASGIVNNWISDWTEGQPPDPIDGFGPYNARLVNEMEPIDERPGPDKGIKFKAIYNADNYVSLAVSWYWARECSTKFKECPDEDSAFPERESPPWPFNVPQS